MCVLDRVHLSVSSRYAKLSHPAAGCRFMFNEKRRVVSIFLQKQNDFSKTISVRNKQLFREGGGHLLLFFPIKSAYTQCVFHKKQNPVTVGCQYHLIREMLSATQSCLPIITQRGWKHGKENLKIRVLLFIL